MSTFPVPVTVQPVLVVVEAGVAAGVAAGAGRLVRVVGAALGVLVFAGAPGGASLTTVVGGVGSDSLALDKIERVTATPVAITPPAATMMTTIKIIFLACGVISTTSLD